MYKLTVVAGPNRGSSYAVQEGDNVIGRQPGLSVVLQSSKVSKRHCVLVVSNGELIVRDEGSSNGTFVNGVLAKSRQVKAGDRISVGEYVLQLVQMSSNAPLDAPEVGGMGNVVRFPVVPRSNSQFPNQVPLPGGYLGLPNHNGIPGIGGNQSPAPAPRKGLNFEEIKEKVTVYFDNRIMPYFYGLNQKYDWRMIAAALFGIFVLLNVIISIYPLMDSAKMMVVEESKRRARFIAKEIVERNSAFIAAGQETKADIGSIGDADGVQMAVLVDKDFRVLAPPAQFSQYLRGNIEANIAAKAKKIFLEGKSGFAVAVGTDLVVAIEPLRIVSSSVGANVTQGMAVVSIDTSLSTPDLGEMGMVYSQALILSGLLGGLILLILYKMTLKPLQILNEDMDRVLKGDMPQVTHEFKFTELDPLWDLINSALQRVPKGDGPGSQAEAKRERGPAVEDYAGPLQAMGEWVKFGMALLDSEKKVGYLNSHFDNLTGIHLDSGLGQEITQLARDQAFTSLLQGLFDRVQPGDSSGVSDEFEFSGQPYKVTLQAVTGGEDHEIRCYVLLIMSREDSVG
jgi:hypothetical protein